MVNLELKGVKEALELFDPNTVRKAANSAINKVAQQVKTDISRRIREDYNIRASDVNRFLKLSARPKGYETEAVITGTGIGIPLVQFDAKQSGITISKGQMRYNKRAGRSKGYRYGGAVSVLVSRSEGRKMVNTDPKAFLAQMKSGHIGVFTRVPGQKMKSNTKKEMIRQRFGPGIKTLLGSWSIMNAARKFINDKFVPVFKHELDYYLGKIKK
jgi:hypothetical protein